MLFALCALCSLPKPITPTAAHPTLLPTSFTRRLGGKINLSAFSALSPPSPFLRVEQTAPNVHNTPHPSASQRLAGKYVFPPSPRFLRVLRSSALNKPPHPPATTHRPIRPLIRFPLSPPLPPSYTELA